jgi:hypothetical protein
VTPIGLSSPAAAEPHPMLVRKSDRFGRVRLNECHLARKLGVSTRTVSWMVAILTA